jgi:hypothetical protein
VNEIRKPNREDELARRLLAPLGQVEPVTRRARRSRRSQLARRLVPVVALAAVVFVVVMVTPWQHGPASSIIQHATAVMGNKPILHAVLRDENASDASFFDLKTGRETRIFGQREIWYDKSGKRFFARLGNEIDGEFTLSEELLVTKEWAATSQPTFSVGWSTTDVPVSVLAGFLDDYRSVLADGSARVTGTGELNGRDVSWIEWAPEPGSCPYSEPYDEKSTCTERVAIDEASSLPVQIAWLHGGTVRYAVDILSIETLSAGSFDFHKPKVTSTALGVSTRDIAATDPNGAAEALPGALWPGESVGSLDLTGVWRAALYTTPTPVELSEPAVELRYGSPNSDFIWSASRSGEKWNGTGVAICKQKADPRFSSLPFSLPSPPAGSMLATPYVGGYRGWLEEDSISVEIDGSSLELLLQAARALTPIEP